jgi:hypothetical protein
MSEFKDKGYLVIRKAVPKELADFIYQYFCNKRKVARLFFDSGYISQFNDDWGRWNDQQIPETYSHYGDLVMETLLEKVQPLIEKQADCKLNPTYSYARIYKKGDVLERHKDRYSCEISATMNLGGDSWKLFIDPTGKGEQTEESYKMGMAKGKGILMNAGDIVMYKGCDLEHWREPFKGENCGQVFFHYNDANKKDAEENKFDTRPFLGLPSWFKGFKIKNTTN